MSLLEAVIGWLAPPVCVGCEAEGLALCEACQTSSILRFGERCYRCNKLSERSRTCLSCRKDSPQYVWISTDYDGLAKDLIVRYKFGHLRTASSIISKTMVETLSSGNSLTDIKDYLVVPVPTASHRIRERGFDHAALLSRHISRHLKVEHKKALRRVGQTRQVGSSRLNRLKQQVDAYYVTDPSFVVGRKILLIDDIVTTGATIRAATRILKKAGAKNVDALVFAKKI